MNGLKRWIGVLATVSMVAMAAPVGAAPPQTVQVPFAIIFLDISNDLVVFWNITRDDLCAWEEDGAEGDLPVQELVTARENETANGAIVVSLQAVRHLELWSLDADADFSGPCQDTDGQDEPFAVGTARVQLNDNDLNVSGSRTNSFGDRGQGKVIAGDGSRWHYSWVFRALIDRDFEFRVVVERTNLVQQGR